jgi:lycopene cyclase domain-containing protein
LIWDYFATKYGHWAFNETFTFGFTVFGMPVSEILFFIAIPLYFITVYEVVSRQDKKFTQPQIKYIEVIIKNTRFIAVPLLIFIAIQSLLGEGRSYTFIVSALTAISLLILSNSPLYSSRPWVLTNAYSYLAFVFFNGILTAAPVVTYSSFETLNYRIGSIPLEDFLYNFTLTNLFLLA